MKIFNTLVAILFLFNVNAQSLYTKDKVSLGPRSVFMESCVGTGEQKMMELDGMSIDVKSYCECAANELIPTLYMADIEFHLNEGDLVQWFIQGENMEILKKCVEPNMEVDDSFKFEENENSELTKKVMVEECYKELLKDKDVSSYLNDEQAMHYCSCAVQKLYENGMTFGELNNIDDEDENAFNEIALPCMLEAMEIGSDSDFYDSNEDSDEWESDVIGDLTSDEVKMIDGGMAGYKVKINIDGIDKYFLLDTGASDMIINDQLEKELLKNGSISKFDYIGETVYELADKSKVKCDVVLLNNVQIGNYTVFNVEAAVLKGGSLLLGMSFLEKFTAWEIKQESSVLLLEK
jgi:clan AA aspartic protease (TIGR02281 family)